MESNSKSSKKKSEKNTSVDGASEKMVKKQKKSTTDSKVTQQKSIDPINDCRFPQITTLIIFSCTAKLGGGTADSKKAKSETADGTRQISMKKFTLDNHRHGRYGFKIRNSD